MRVKRIKRLVLACTTAVLSAWLIAGCFHEDDHETITNPGPLSFEFVKEWGGPGTGNGQFTSISGLATDGKGYVFASDAIPNAPGRVQKFTTNGVYHSKFSDASIVFPVLGAVDMSGNVFVDITTGGNRKIRKYSSSSSVLKTFGEGGTPRVDRAGNVYELRIGNTGWYINKYTNAGVHSKSWSVENGFGAIAVDYAGYVYIGVASADRIIKMSSSGDFVSEWPAAGFVYGLAVDNAGYVYALEHEGNNVWKLEAFTTSGQAVATSPALGTWTGGMTIAADASGVYVGKVEGNRILRYRLQ